MFFKGFYIPILTFAVVMRAHTVHGEPFALVMEQLTTTQQLAIEELRDLVQNELKADYMREDSYLAKWLSSSDFNVKEAQERILENLAWMDIENIHNVLNENWSDMEVKFPYSVNTRDKFGSPILTLDMRQWNIASYFTLQDASSELLARYFVKMFEDALAQARQSQSEGNNDVTQFNVLVDMAGFSTEKHISFRSLQFYHSLGSYLYTHYPHIVGWTMLVNVNSLFQTAYSVLAEECHKNVILFGQDRETWESVLLQLVDQDQLPERLLASEALAEKENSKGLLEWNEGSRRNLRMVLNFVDSKVSLDARAKSVGGHLPLYYKVPAYRNNNFRVYQNYGMDNYFGKRMRESGSCCRCRKRFYKKFPSSAMMKKNCNRKLVEYYSPTSGYFGSVYGGSAPRPLKYRVLKHSLYQWPGNKSPVIYPLSYCR